MSRKGTKFHPYNQTKRLKNSFHPCPTAFPLQSENFATAVGELCYRRGRTLPWQRENFATATGELCHGNGRTLPRQSENFVVFLLLHPLRIATFATENVKGREEWIGRNTNACRVVG
jgi:hypothetical protein